jgi:hypothetical protein
MLWHCGHSDKPGAVIFILGALLESLFAFDVFLFGTAIAVYLLVVNILRPLKSSSAT